MKKLLENFRKCIAEELMEGRTSEWKWFLEEMAVEVLQALSILHNKSLKNSKMAEKYLLMAKFIDPGNFKIHLNLCDFYHSMMNLAEAERFAKLSIESSYYENASAFNNAAIISSEKNDFDKTLEYYEKAIELENNNYLAKFGLACEKIRRGNLQEGWSEYQIRYKAFKHLQNFLDKYPSGKYWDGLNHPTKNLVVYSEQGIGDFIFAMRYLPDLYRKKIKIYFDVDSNIKSILSNSKIKKLRYFDHGIKVDYFCGMMSLPYLLKSYEYNSESYLNIFHQAKNVLDDKPKIGITIAGNKSHASDYRRSINLSELSQILDDTRFDFYFLQTKNDLVRERKCEFINLVDRNFPGIDLGNKLVSYESTLKILGELDAIVTVDTSVAHLAAAIGLPVFILLDKACDFRWNIDGTKTSWYSMWRMHKQTKLFDWDDAVSNCHMDLLQFFKIEV